MLAAVLCSGIVAAASDGDRHDPLAVKAEIADYCTTLTASAVVFGTFQFGVGGIAPVLKNSTVSFTCTKGAPLISLSASDNSSDGSCQLSSSNPSNTKTLKFTLTSLTGTPSGTDLCNVSPPGIAYGLGTGSGSLQTITLQASLSPSQITSAIPAGTYSDIVTLTLTY